VVVAITAFSLVFVAPASQTAFLVGGGLPAHECPGGAVVATIPPTDVVVVTGWRYQGRLGNWSAVTWDDSAGPAPVTRLVWVTDDELRETVGDSALRDDGDVVTDPAFDRCTPPPSVLSKEETPVSSSGPPTAVVTDQPETTTAQTSVAPPATTPAVTTTAKRPTTTKPVATTPTAPSTTPTATSTTTSPTTTAATSTTTTVPKVVMPDLLGLPEQDARQKLTDLGLHVNVLLTLLQIGDSRNGLVVSQLPPVGAPVPLDATAIIGVGHVPDVIVPDVVGLVWYPDAVNILESAGFKVAFHHDPAGDLQIVQAQDPPAGAHVPFGTWVTLTANNPCGWGC
jgi:hypothetical protein